MTLGSLAGAESYGTQFPAGRSALASYTSETNSLLPERYTSGVTPMAKANPSEALSWSFFQWVVSVLGVAIVGLVSLLYANLTSDVSDLKEASQEATRHIVGIHRELADFRLETAKAFGAVHVQATETNANLRNLSDRFPRR